MVTDFFIPSSEWEKMIQSDPLPVNPFYKKWGELICSFGFSYSCMYCGKCPYGEYWKIPEEDEKSEEYQNYLKEWGAWKERHLGWEKALMDSEIQITDRRDSDDST